MSERDGVEIPWFSVRLEAHVRLDVDEARSLELPAEVDTDNWVAAGTAERQQTFEVAALLLLFEASAGADCSEHSDFTAGFAIEIPSSTSSLTCGSLAYETKNFLDRSWAMSLTLAPHLKAICMVVAFL